MVVGGVVVDVGVVDVVGGVVGVGVDDVASVVDNEVVAVVRGYDYGEIVLEPPDLQQLDLQQE